MFEFFVIFHIFIDLSFIFEWFWKFIAANIQEGQTYKILISKYGIICVHSGEIANFDNFWQFKNKGRVKGASKMPIFGSKYLTWRAPWNKNKKVVPITFYDIHDIFFLFSNSINFKSYCSTFKNFLRCFCRLIIHKTWFGLKW